MFFIFGLQTLHVVGLLHLQEVTNMTQDKHRIMFIDCTGLTSFPENLFDNCLTADFTNVFANTKLPEGSFEAILVSLNSNSTSNGTFNQPGGSDPSSAG